MDLIESDKIDLTPNERALVEEIHNGTYCGIFDDIGTPRDWVTMAVINHRPGAVKPPKFDKPGYYHEGVYLGQWPTDSPVASIKNITIVGGKFRSDGKPAFEWMSSDEFEALQNFENLARCRSNEVPPFEENKPSETSILTKIKNTLTKLLA